MGNTAVKGYTDVWGKHGAAIYDHTGPASYSQWTAPNTGGEVVTPQPFGLRNIDIVIPIGFTVSGNYFVEAKMTAGAGGNLTKAILVWFAVTLPSGVLTLTQVAASTNLSAETIRLLVIGG